jgi:hypothetical protein
MKVDGIYNICNISDKEIAELDKTYQLINCEDRAMFLNMETGAVTFGDIRIETKPLDLSKEVSCKILLIQESGNKLIEYATITGETPACIYFP